MPSRHRRTVVALVAVAVALGLQTAVVPAAPAAAQPSLLEGPVPETRSATVRGLPSAYTAAGVGGATSLSAPVEGPIPFAMVGLELPPGASARLRTSLDGRAWGAWRVPGPLQAGDDGPDLGTAEAAGAVDVDRFTDPLWVGEARFLQVDVSGAAPGDVNATLIDTLGLSSDGDEATGGKAVHAAAVADPVMREEATGDGEPGDEEPGEGEAVAISAFPKPTMPGVISRSEWKADESRRKASPSYAKGGVKFAVIHHTAGGNTYSEKEAPAVVRGIFRYHTEVLGWSDVGYNVLVDRYGNVYEGRAGGIDSAVVGAHAQGFNTGSLGVSVLGEFTSAPPPKAALDAVADVVAWSFKRHGVDPSGQVAITSAGSNKYSAGKQVSTSTIFGHRDVGLTACPGNAFYAKLPTLRTMAADRVEGLPALAPLPAPVVKIPPMTTVPIKAPPTTVPPPAPAPAVPSFTDTAGSVHAANIERLVRSGITTGCGGGRFCPDDPVTRAQAVTFIGRAAGLAPGGSETFSDVPDGHTHAAAISAAVRAGFVSGYADGTFHPEALVSREQLASMLAKAKGLARRPGQFFTDVPWSSVHLANVNAIGAAGLSEGCGGGRYCPNGSTTRAQMATFVATAFAS